MTFQDILQKTKKIIRVPLPGGRSPALGRTFFKNLNLCFFVGLVLLSLHHKIILYNLPDISEELLYYVGIPLVNGLLTGIICLGLNYYFAKKHFTQYTFNTENKPALFLTGFIAGIACIYIVLDELTTYAITALIVYAAYINIKSFAGNLSGLLAPDERASTRDLSEFTSFFINLLITFSVINLSLNTIHISLGTQIAFNFSEGVQGILDAIYFGLITMTTVGYGDIYPHSSVARAVVGLECLTSYVLLGIMIGIVSRGVDFGSKASK